MTFKQSIYDARGGSGLRLLKQEHFQNNITLYENNKILK